MYSLKPPSIFDKLSRFISREHIREVSCFSCDAKQQLSSAAESTSCPKCGSYIDLRDFKISGPFGRSIQTQGEVDITSKGDATSQRILCGGARIEGKMRGNMRCTGVVRIKLDGKLIGGVEAGSVVVEKKSNVEFAKPIHAKSVEISGKTVAEVFCDGKVTITKTGSLIGVIHARAIVIDKGGIFSGDLHIGVNAEDEVTEEEDKDESLALEDPLPPAQALPAGPMQRAPAPPPAAPTLSLRALPTPTPAQRAAETPRPTEPQRRAIPVTGPPKTGLPPRRPAAPDRRITVLPSAIPAPKPENKPSAPRPGSQPFPKRSAKETKEAEKLQDEDLPGL